VTLRSGDLHSPAPFSPLIETSARPFGDINNPWLAHSSVLDGSSKLARKNNEVVVNKDSKSADKSKNKLKKEQRKREETRESARDDATLEISMENVLQLDQVAEQPQAPTSHSQNKRTSVRKPTAAGNDDDEEDVNSEVDAQEQEALRKAKGKGRAGPMAFQQRDLVARAFAGDNVVRVSISWITTIRLNLTPNLPSVGIRRCQTSRNCRRCTKRN
jgi:U3 small nucleolar RNA-associated protein 14